MLQQLKVTNEIVQAYIKIHQERNKERHDLNIKLPEFQQGDKVLIKINKVPKGLSSKLHDKADGPYEIIELGPNFTYKLKRCSDNKVHQSLMNATNLKIYHDPSEHREHLDDYDRQPPTQQSQPPGQLDDNTNTSQEDQTNNNSYIPDPPQTANGTGEATPPTDHETSQHQYQPMPALPQDPNKQWKLRNFLAGRF